MFTCPVFDKFAAQYRVGQWSFTLSLLNCCLILLEKYSLSLHQMKQAFKHIKKIIFFIIYKRCRVWPTFNLKAFDEGLTPVRQLHQYQQLWTPWKCWKVIQVEHLTVTVSVFYFYNNISKAASKMLVEFFTSSKKA